MIVVVNRFCVMNNYSVVFVLSCIIVSSCHLVKCGFESSSAPSYGQNYALTLKYSNDSLVLEGVVGLRNVLPAKHIDHLQLGGTALPIDHVEHPNGDRPIRGVKLGDWPDGVMFWIRISSRWCASARSFFNQVSFYDFNNLTDVDRSEDDFDILRGLWL